MNKILLLIMLVVLLFSNKVYSQRDVQGLIVGCNSTIVMGHNSSRDIDSYPGYYIGFFVERFLRSNISVQFDYLYSKQGVRDINHQMDFDLRYVSESQSLKYWIYNCFNIQVGLGFYYNIYAKTRFRNELLDLKDDINLRLNKINVDLNLGVEYVFNSKVNLNFRYGFGLFNFAKNYKVRKLNYMFGITYAR